MNVIMYYPKSEEMKRELEKRVAIVHAEAVIKKLKSLSCPIEQKLALIEAVKKAYKNKDGA